MANRIYFHEFYKSATTGRKHKCSLLAFLLYTSPFHFWSPLLSSSPFLSTIYSLYINLGLRLWRRPGICCLVQLWLSRLGCGEVGRLVLRGRFGGLGCDNAYARLLGVDGGHGFKNWECSVVLTFRLRKQSLSRGGFPNALVDRLEWDWDMFIWSATAAQGS